VWDISKNINAQRPIAKKKKKKMGGVDGKSKVPDYQRFHA